MIPVLELLIAIDNKINKLSTLTGQYIPNETKIEVLNKSQLKLVLNHLDLNNNYRSGMDSFSKRYQDLQVLQVPYEKLTLTDNDDTLNSYKVLLSSLTKDMIVSVNGYVTADRDGCKDRVLDIIDVMKHGDIRFLIKSPHYKPSFEYQEVLASISSGVFYVYGNEDFTVNELYLSYLRYPVNMDVTGYIHIDGSVSANVDCELEYYLADELVNIAVEEIADATANQEQSQLSRQRIKESE